ncbi:Rogdi leucine zipper containing protein-domain-containing protein [Tirmania nivea]|nr:Rogdi leucine zipper containing protein-domain-containing protein [Tirmania nivea]
MSTAVYPPIAEQALLQEEQASAARELSWLLLSLQDTLLSLRTGLQECIALIQPTEPASTLVLSSPRSEALKGYVTRVGDRIVKGDMQIKMYGLPPPKGLSAFRLRLAAPVSSIASPTLSRAPSPFPTPLPPSIEIPPHSHHPSTLHSSPHPPTLHSSPNPPTIHITTTPSHPFPHLDHLRQSFGHSPTPGRFCLPQLTHLRTHLHNALHILSEPPLSLPSKTTLSTNPDTILRLTAQTMRQLTNLLKEMHHAKAALTAPPPRATFPYTSTPESIFDPNLPPHLAFDLTIHEGALVAELRTVEFLTPHQHDPHHSELTSSVRRGFASIFNSFAAAAGGAAGAGHKPGLYEEVDKVVVWDGKGEVRVKDKVRVESQDPRLMAVMVKVGGLEHGIWVAMGALEVVKESLRVIGPGVRAATAVVTAV